MENPVEIYRAGNAVQAHLMAAALEEEGIQAVVVDDVPVYMPSTPQIMMSPPAARARELVQKLERHKAAERCLRKQLLDHLAAVGDLHRAAVLAGEGGFQRDAQGLQTVAITSCEV